MRQLAKEAAAAQESEAAFAESKKKGKGKGKGGKGKGKGGKGKGKGKGKGRKGKGRGRGKKSQDENDQHEDDDTDMLKCTEDLDGPHGTFEENMEIRKPERKTPKPKHTQHAEPVRIASVTPIKSSKPPALKRLALLRSKSRSSSSLSVRGAQTNKLRTRSTKRRLEFGDVEAKESLEAPLAIPVSSKRKRSRNKGGEGQGVASAATAAAETKETPKQGKTLAAPAAKKSEPSVERQAQKEPRVCCTCS